jgi:hypothetical protein
MDPSFSCPLKTFTLLPNLPLELRLKIWQHAQPTRRLVIYGRYTSNSPIPSTKPSPHLPITAFINRESRAETLKSYSLIRPLLQPIIAFNPHRDTLLLWYNIWPYLQLNLVHHLYAGPELEIRSLGIPFATIEVDFKKNLEELASHVHLEELVLWQERDWEDSMVETVVECSMEVEEMFKLRTEAQRLCDFVRYLDENKEIFREGKRPVVKFMRVKQGGLGREDI